MLYTNYIYYELPDGFFEDYDFTGKNQLMIMSECTLNGLRVWYFFYVDIYRQIVWWVYEWMCVCVLMMMIYIILKWLCGLRDGRILLFRIEHIELWAKYRAFASSVRNVVFTPPYQEFFCRAFVANGSSLLNESAFVNNNNVMYFELSTCARSNGL